MEHIVTIAINIDDDDLKAKIEDKIVRDVTSKLLEDIKGHILLRYGGVTGAATKVISMAVDSCKTEIVDKASEDVALSIKRSAKYKDVLRKIEQIGAELEEYYGNQ